MKYFINIFIICKFLPLINTWQNSICRKFGEKNFFIEFETIFNQTWNSAVNICVNRKLYLCHFSHLILPICAYHWIEFVGKSKTFTLKLIWVMHDALDRLIDWKSNGSTLTKKKFSAYCGKILREKNRNNCVSFWLFSSSRVLP